MKQTGSSKHFYTIWRYRDPGNLNIKLHAYAEHAANVETRDVTDTEPGERALSDLSNVS